MKIKNIKDLEGDFKDKELLRQAMVHRSWINENRGQTKTNERLEFLGDAVLEFVVSAYLFNKLPERDEGYLTLLRAKFVNTENLADVADRLNAGEYLHLSKGEIETGGKQKPSLLADTVEAIIGAIYIDRGMEAAKKFIEEYILFDFSKKISEPLKDPKSRLQEEASSRKINRPRYQVIKETGPPHLKEFVVRVLVGDGVKGEGRGHNKAAAQRQAAARALVKLGSKA